MSVRLVLTAQAEDLVGAFTAELTEAKGEHVAIDHRRSPGVLRRYPVPAAFPRFRSTSGSYACPPTSDASRVGSWSPPG